MIKYRYILVVLLTISSAYAQHTEFRWPIKDGQNGKGIMYTPHRYIDNELNMNDLYITAIEGTTIISPVDGVIDRVAVGYLESLNVSRSFTYEMNFNRSIENINHNVNNKYLHGLIVVRTSDGRKVQIRGLIGDNQFKTGQQIKAGTSLGQIGYSYSKIDKPSIQISISKESKPQDPMTPFGLRTTFVEPQEIIPITSLTKEQAKEDFIYYINAIKELYPGINNTVTSQELDEYIAKILISIDNFDNDVLFVDFWEIMQRSMAKIHDCHITLFEPQWKWCKETNYSPQIRFGWICDKFICTMAVDIYEQYIGKEIVRINGLSADSIKKFITSKITSYDADVKGFIEFVCATTGMLIFFEKYGNYNMEVEFVDGEKINFIGETSKNRHRYVGSWFNFHKINAHQEGYSTKVLNDSTAYLGISTFNNFSQVAIDDIATFIKSLPQTHNLIIDLRNNYGGSDEVVSKIFSFVVLDTLRLEGYSKVNKKGGFNTVLMNYYGVDEDIFPEFSKKEGKDGFYKLNNSFYAPDSSVNFKGKLYVLINENSVSAASLFASLVVRSHRGAIVGRESRNAYHFMNAAKFGDFKLPNSTLIVRIPLVEIVFDTVVNQRVPWGRGVLPDYFVPLTLDELTSKNGDTGINYTLQLIANGEYISKENPFTMQVQKQYNIQHYWAFIVICSALIGLIFLYLRHK